MNQIKFYSDWLVCCSKLRQLASCFEVEFEKQGSTQLMESMSYFDKSSTELFKSMKLIKSELRSILNKME